MTDSYNQSVLSKEQIDSVIALYTRGQYQEVIDQIKVLNEKYPNVPLLFNIVGACYKALGQFQGAAKMFETAVNIKPNYAEAHKNLGITLKELGEFDAAVASLRKAIIIDSEYIDAHYNLAITFKDYDHFNDAVNSYKRVLEINPNFAEAHNNLGNVFKDLEQLDEAVKSYKKAISCNQNLSDPHYNLGVTLKKLRQLDGAVQSLNNSIIIKPDFANAHNNLGSCFILLGQMTSAIECYEKAIEIKPDYAEAHNNLGNVFNALGKFKEGAQYFEKAIVIDPYFAEAHNGLGDAYKKLKKRDKALLYYERAGEIKPGMDFILGEIVNTKMHLNIWDDLMGHLKDIKKKIANNEKAIDPFNLMGLVDDPALQRRATEIRVNSAYPNSDVLPKIDYYSRHKKIRIGYFSGDFRIHPVAYLTAELYEVHDRDHFEIHAFSFGPDTKDELNLRIKAGVDHFHDLRSMSHKKITLLARSLEIDIAVDLSGLTEKARTDVFAMKVAPIQLSYIGYLGTMGADYYDYLIADEMMIPKKNQKYYAEKIVYLPSFQVNDSTESIPKITLTRKDLGLPKEGFIFCCFSNTFKITPKTFDSWARILKNVEGSVLMIYAANELSKTNLTKEIIKRGIDSSRLIFGDSFDRPKYLARYRVADLFLDTQPYNAGTTASDALRMGLPMLTLKGQSYQSRMGASIVNALDLPELITNTSEEYESLAIKLAIDPVKFKAIKDKLVDNLPKALLYDTPLFSKHLELAYTKMYENFHSGLDPDHIYLEHHE
ncbi:tetratricopeptide repeat protein [Candidatus Thioglobus sp.]|nr:tetratricopeptide repeat protein [Candidatus Thioglobus sp.]